MLNDTGYEGWKQLYGEMASRERGVDTIRIVLESGPVLVRTRGRTFLSSFHLPVWVNYANVADVQVFARSSLQISF